jgi:hypothetical protein
MKDYSLCAVRHCPDFEGIPRDISLDADFGIFSREEGQ